MTARKKPEDKKRAGRKTDFKREYIELGYNYALLGAIDTEMADFFGVSEQTFNSWKKKEPAFLESIKAGKVQSDAKVALRLLDRALGYDYEEVHIERVGRKIKSKKTLHKQMPPDTVAAIFWLKNRQPEKWRDKQYNELTGKDGKDLSPTVIILPAKNQNE